MGEKNWYRPTFLTLVVLGVVLIFTGASLTEPGTEELAYGRSGSFYIEDYHADMSIVVFTDDEDANCEEFDLTVDRHDGTYDFVGEFEESMAAEAGTDLVELSPMLNNTFRHSGVQGLFSGQSFSSEFDFDGENFVFTNAQMAWGPSIGFPVATLVGVLLISTLGAFPISSLNDVSDAAENELRPVVVSGQLPVSTEQPHRGAIRLQRQRYGHHRSSARRP